MAENKVIRTIGVLTSGGDAPGMNAAIRAVVRTAKYFGMEIYGIRQGYSGLISDDMVPMEMRSVSDIVQRGGTMLRTARCVEMYTVEGQKQAVKTLNDRGIVASCEIDLCSAITMRAMALASGRPTACLDWNNNYGADENKVILFHCGPVAQSLMAGKGTVTEHKMFAKGDPGSGWGSNEGRIAAFDMTFSNCFTENGRLKVYASEARFTGEPIEEGYFGCGGVAEIPDLQNKLLRLAKGGFKHHTTVGTGHMKAVLEEAFSTYLHYDIVDIER